MPDLLDVQRVRLVSEALAEPKTSGRRASLEHCANLVWRLGQGWQSYWQQVLLKLFNKKFNEMRGPVYFMALSLGDGHCSPMLPAIARTPCRCELT